MTSKNWQLGNQAAQRYEEIAVKAILGPFAEALVDSMNLDKIHTVVDMGCGTGVATRLVAKRMEKTAKVIGIDVNEGMIAVAKSLPKVTGAMIEWKQESVHDLSLDSDSVDAVLSAQSLQFMNTQRALSQIHRVLKEKQTFYLSLWCEIEKSPYFDSLYTAISKHIGEETSAGLGSAFKLGKIDEIKTILEEAHFSIVQSEISELHLNLAPMAEFVPQHLNATPMGAKYQATSATTQQAILDDITSALSEYQTDTGLYVPFCSHLVKATK